MVTVALVVYVLFWRGGMPMDEILCHDSILIDLYDHGLMCSCDCE